MAQVDNIENVFELHRASDIPTKRLLVVFAAANSKSFTFFKATQQMQLDKLYVRDPNGNAWYQNGLAEGETLQHIEDRIAEAAKDYREIWMLGSSMGGYAAMYFGARLKARRVLAIAPQIVVDSRFARGPKKSTPVQTPDIVADVRAANTTQFTIVFGSFDLIDAYNIAQLYSGDRVPMNFRVVQYENQDHLLPIEIDRAISLKQYFQIILSHNALPDIGIPYTEGCPISGLQRTTVETYVRHYLEQDYAAIFAYLSDIGAQFPDWAPIHFTKLQAGLRAGHDPNALLQEATDLSDAYPKAIDFAYLAAQVAEAAGQGEMARQHLVRVFKQRSSHPPGRKMMERLQAFSDDALEVSQQPAQE